MLDPQSPLFQTVFDVLPIGAFIVDSEKKIIAWNQWLVKKRG